MITFRLAGPHGHELEGKGLRDDDRETAKAFLITPRTLGAAISPRFGAAIIVPQDDEGGRRHHLLIDFTGEHTLAAIENLFEAESDQEFALTQGVPELRPLLQAEGQESIGKVRYRRKHLKEQPQS